MENENNILIAKLKNEFEIIWDDLCIMIPDLKKLFPKMNIKKLGEKYAKKIAKLSDSNQNKISAPCLLDQFIASKIGGIDSNNFCDEIKCISDTIRTALNYARSFHNEKIYSKIKVIIKNLIITMDDNPLSTNPDYRSRFHELLVFNMLMECENIEVTDIDYKLDNGKDCDFRCVHTDGSELLIEVMSIHNIELNKQDDALSFSEFINKKIQNKYDDKTKGLTHIDKFHILPILEYDERIGDFGPTLDPTISLPAYTVTKNISSERIEPILIQIEGIQNLFNKEI